jgi:hypothetical protein
MDRAIGLDSLSCQKKAWFVGVFMPVKRRRVARGKIFDVARDYSAQALSSRCKPDDTNKTKIRQCRVHWSRRDKRSATCEVSGGWGIWSPSQGK